MWFGNKFWKRAQSPRELTRDIRIKFLRNALMNFRFGIITSWFNKSSCVDPFSLTVHQSKDHIYSVYHRKVQNHDRGVVFDFLHRGEAL